MQVPEVMTVPEAAQYLRAHPKTVSAKILSGVLPGRKVGRSYRIRREDLDAYLKGDPKAAELTAEEQLSIWREVEAEVSARYPLEMEPLPSDYEAAQDALWRALGYEDGYSLENWLREHEHSLKRHVERLEQAEGSLSPKERATLNRGRLIKLANAEVKEEHRKETWRLARATLWNRGYELAVDPDAEMPAFVTAVKTGEGLLRRAKK